MPEDTPDPALRLHGLTKHGVRVDRSELVSFQPLDPHNRPTPFKRYRDLDHVPLLGELEPPPADAAEVLSGSSQPAGALDAAALSRLLFLSAGVTRTARTAVGHSFFRAAMSAGNLHPLEVYVACPDLGPIDAGLYHFAPDRFVLDRLRSGDHRGRLAEAGGEELTGCGIVVTGLPWRTGWKYGERGWRHLWWDCGTMLANLLAVADASGLAPRLWLGFVDDRVSELVGVDGSREVPLVVLSIGEGPPPADPASDIEPLDVGVDPISPAPLTFPLVTAAHRAGDLANAAAVERWRLEGSTLGRAATTEVQPPSAARGATIDEVILRRGSTRVMRQEEVPTEALTWPLAVASRPLPWDVVPNHRALVGHYVNVHAVAAMEPGAYQLVAGGPRLIRAEPVRDASTHLCLDQQLGGDSAFTVFHAADLDVISETLGPRGYRAAQLEAGVASGRLALAAFALGMGASGLTFYDDEVSAFFETDEQPMLVTTVGVPDYRNRPGGQPGRPVELTNFERIQERLIRKLRRY